jgi:hypothetical protein
MIKSSVENVLKGNTAVSRILSCDRVIMGAFFPQPYLDMPEKEMTEHGNQDVTIPARVLPYLVMIHPEFRFGFFKTLFYGPAYSTEPDESFEPAISRGVADIVKITPRITIPFDDQPYLFCGKPFSG